MRNSRDNSMASAEQKNMIAKQPTNSSLEAELKRLGYYKETTTQNTNQNHPSYY